MAKRIRQRQCWMERSDELEMPRRAEAVAWRPCGLVRAMSA